MYSVQWVYSVQVGTCGFYSSSSFLKVTFIKTKYRKCPALICIPPDFWVFWRGPRPPAGSCLPFHPAESPVEVDFCLTNNFIEPFFAFLLIFISENFKLMFVCTSVFMYYTLLAWAKWMGLVYSYKGRDKGLSKEIQDSQKLLWSMTRNRFLHFLWIYFYYQFRQCMDRSFQELPSLTCWSSEVTSWISFLFSSVSLFNLINKKLKIDIKLLLF